MTADSAPIRPGEEIDAGALGEYLRGRVEGADQTVSVEQFPGGHSNLTYLVKAGPREYVLRRAPLGPVAPKAHDMAREYAVLRAVHPHFPPAPRPLLLCEDAGVVGAVFFLMERRHGVIIRTEVPPELARLPDFPERASGAFVDCLATLHRVDIERHGLAAIGKPEGFLERQVHGWADRWNRAKTEEMPAMDRVIEWLDRAMPASPAPTLVHNDFKLDNLMLDPADPGRITAVLDWEMTTVGDPLADLGLTLCYWSPPDGSGVSEGPVAAVTASPGWYTRERLIDEYARQTGRDVSRIGYHEILGIFKLAVIVQQIYFRWHRGQTRDDRFSRFNLRVRSLVEAAAQRIERMA
jgi:aminoglycoside phosphotransferase (APT) family kinase protein